MSWKVVLILGFSNIIADALAMGVGEYLSSKAHKDFVVAEKRREQWEFRNNKEGEINEMIDIFTKRGMDRTDADLVIRKMAQYETFFINLMISEELGLHPPEENDSILILDAFIMFISFSGFGSIPILAYLLGPLNNFSDHYLYIISCIITGLSLFLLGCVKSTFR